ncbi:hypothetical protein BKA69DRAFT_1125458 [Paraphysoderma sedebokerense]|nr:hypothetical protein BKA69DRAFT_1125458 [Paraphysoderma sedebokerense]
MKVFISDLDTPVGHNLSRILSSTLVGSRRQKDDSDDYTSNEDGNSPTKKSHSYYEIAGTLFHSANPDAEVPPELEVDGMDPAGKNKEIRELMDKRSKKGKAGSWVKEVIPKNDTEKIKQQILESDVVVFDLLHSVSQANWAFETVLPENIGMFVDKPKIVIAISSIMTWAKTKPDPADPDAPFLEEDYRKRRTHPNFRDHLAAEKALNKLGKTDAFKTYVVSSGLCYHHGDSVIHHMLQSAWSGQPELPIYGDGDNFLPMIHLDDLCSILLQAIETTPDFRYIVAIDDAKHTYLEVATAISELLGTGKVKLMPKEQALLRKDFTQTDYDMLTLNLRLEVSNAKKLGVEWKSEAGIIENLPALIRQYKEGRGLTPLKIMIHGPPASGKTTIAKMIAEYYQLHFVDPEVVVKEAIDRLERRVHPPPLGPDSTDVQSVEDTEPVEEAEKELLEELQEALKNNNGVYPKDYVISFLKAKLNTMPCLNQGYALDGYPTTLDEASALFKAEGDSGVQNTESYIPEFIISLEASDDFIKDRIMKLPESEVEGTKNSEEALLKRLEEYRAKSTEEAIVLNFFDELEIHPHSIDIESVLRAGNDTSTTGGYDGINTKGLNANQLNERVLERIKKFVGKPHNYGLSEEEIIKRKKTRDLEKAKTAEAAREAQERLEAEEMERQNKVMEEWNIRINEVRQQEKEVLETQSLPLRNYLMKHVLPTLTTGLIEVCKVRPEDPIDYLAEFLFKNSGGPEI